MRNFGLKAMTLAAAAVMTLGTAMAQAGGDTMAQDKMFIMNATKGGNAEILASKMALKKSHNDEIKAFAQKMVDDHDMILKNMQPFADKYHANAKDGVVVLTKPEQEEARRLKAKSGDSFDKEYVSAMVADHHKDLGDFMHEADTTSDADLKAAVQQAQATIQEHTDMIDAIAKKMNIATPPPAPGQ